MAKKPFPFKVCEQCCTTGGGTSGDFDGVISKSQVDETIITEDDIASTSKAGIVQISQWGGLVYSPALNGLGIDVATKEDIDGKNHIFKPVATDSMDYAIAVATHNDMSDEYDPASLTVGQYMDGMYGKVPGDLPVSYDAVKNYVDSKDDKTITFANGETITVADNTTYIAQGEISTLTIVYLDTDFLCSLHFTLASEGDITITLPESKYIGGAPTFANGETWELNIKNGVVVGGKVE